MLKFGAKLISVIFHPLLVLGYIFGILVLVNPYLPDSLTTQGKAIFLIYFVVNTIIIPVLAIFIMRMLGFINSVQMETTKERIGPMIVVLILYLWMYINFKKEPGVPLMMVSIMLGTVLSTAAAFVVNVFNKISLHMTGMGGLLAATTLIFLHQNITVLTISPMADIQIQLHFVLVLIILIIIAGVVASSRLLLNAHRPAELWQGAFLGFFAQFIAYWITF